MGCGGAEGGVKEGWDGIEASIPVPRHFGLSLPYRPSSWVDSGRENHLCGLTRKGESSLWVGSNRKNHLCGSTL